MQTARPLSRDPDDRNGPLRDPIATGYSRPRLCGNVGAVSCVKVDPSVPARIDDQGFGNGLATHEYTTFERFHTVRAEVELSHRGCG